MTHPATNPADQPPAPLPVFTPSPAAVDAAARRLASEADPAMSRHDESGVAGWDRAAPYVRHWWRQRALDVIAAAGSHLVADALGYAALNANQLGLTTSAAHDVQSACMQVREHAAASQGGSLFG